MNIQDNLEMMIKAQSGVVYWKGKPGVGKTAVLEKIAEKNGWVYVDRRLSQKDSSEIVGLPRCRIDKDSGIEVMHYAYPQYLVDANKKPTLIVFEELNRAVLETRNASLQILNERRVEDLELNENVFMCATGNLGEADGTEVEEFDSALRGRLIHFTKTATIDDWKNEFATKHVNPYIIQFIEANPSYFHRLPENEDGAYPSPRTYTFLSDLVGKDTKPRDMYSTVEELGVCYIGNATRRLLTFLENNMNLNINDVINRYPQVEEELKKLNRDKYSELLNELENMNIAKMKNEQYDNVNKFLELIDPDEKYGFLTEILTKFGKKEYEANKHFANFLKEFKDDYIAIQEKINIAKNIKKEK